MICPKCKKEGLVALVNVLLEIDANDERAIDKTMIRKRSTIILGVERGKIKYTCPHCHWSSTDIVPIERYNHN